MLVPHSLLHGKYAICVKFIFWQGRVLLVRGLGDRVEKFLDGFLLVMERLQPLEALEEDYYLDEGNLWYNDNENHESER